MTDDPLLTPEGSIVAAEFMWLLNRATLVGHPAPVVAQMRAQMDSPSPGDRVVVMDHIYGNNADLKWKSSGVLLSVEFDEELGQVWSVKYGPNDDDICRWSNCTVQAIPDRTRQSDGADDA